MQKNFLWYPRLLCFVTPLSVRGRPGLLRLIRRFKRKRASWRQPANSLIRNRFQAQISCFALLLPLPVSNTNYIGCLFWVFIPPSVAGDCMTFRFFTHWVMMVLWKARYECLTVHTNFPEYALEYPGWYILVFFKCLLGVFVGIHISSGNFCFRWLKLERLEKYYL